MAEFAERVVVDVPNKTVLINGVEFPWLIQEDGIEVRNLIARDSFASITIEIPAGSIEVIPDVS